MHLLPNLVNKLTFACIYIDFQSAFASIVRGIALEPLLSAEDLCHRLSARGFDDADIKSILEGVNDFTFWQESGGSHHLSVLTSRIHRCSWFAVDGVPGCYESCCGALAGTSLADVIFLLAFSRVLHAVEARLRSAGAMFKLPAAIVATRVCIIQAGHPMEGLGQSLGPIAFVDDVAQPLIASANEICSLVRSVISIYHATFERFLLTANYSRANRKLLFLSLGKAQPWQSTCCNMISLMVSHLGPWIVICFCQSRTHTNTWAPSLRRMALCSLKSQRSWPP